MKAGVVLTALIVALIAGCGEGRDAEARRAWYAQQREVQERQNAKYDRQLAQVDEQIHKADEQLQKQEEQDQRFDAILDRWEDQARRTELILDRWERLLAELEARGQGARGATPTDSTGEQ